MTDTTLNNAAIARDIGALIAERDDLRSRLARVEALYGGEPPPVWIEGTKIVRLTRRDPRLGCDITESYLRVEDVRAALAAVEPDTEEATS